MNRPGTMLLIAPLALVAAVALAQAGTDATPPPAAKGPPPPPAPETVSSRPGAVPGERLYLEKCAMCHGAGGMGTGLLARRVDQPLLERRDDLTADYIVQAARSGIGNMPAIPRGEVSDAAMARIADYLAGKKAPVR